MNNSDIEHVWKYDLDLSGWNWKSSGEYILHAWSLDTSNQVKHTQVVIHK